MSSGRPDWFGTIVAAGKYDDIYIPIALDVDGFITATMKGLYDELLKTIAVDSSGVMKANLSVQDLDFLTVRPAYGEVKHLGGITPATKETTTTIYTVSGKGVILSGWMQSLAATTSEMLSYELYIDGLLLIYVSPFWVRTRYHYAPENNPIYLICYDELNFNYIVGVQPKITFETSFQLKVGNPYSVDYDVTWRLYYALVP